MSELHVVLGASGSIGNAIIRALSKQGKQVRGVNRSGRAMVDDDVTIVSADANSLDDMRRVLDGASVVYNATFPAMQDAVLEAASETNLKYVLINNLYMYDPSEGAMSESSRIDYGNREGGKFYDELAQQVIAAHKAGKIRGTVGRASDIYGKHVRHGYSWDLVYAPALQGKAASILGSADVPHSFSYADDAGKQFAMLGTSDQADGEIWHFPVMDAITQRHLLELIYAETGHDVSFRAADGFIMAMLGLFNSDMQKMKREKLYQFTTPWTVDSSKYERTFRRDVTPVAQAVKETVAWFRANPGWS